MESYLRWLQHLETHDTPLYELSLVLPHLGIKERKVLLAMSRCQVVPRKSSRLYRHFPARSWTIPFSLPPAVRRITASHNLYDLCQILSPYMTPFFCGFISMLIRNAPYMDYSSAISERSSSIQKELQAALGKYHPVSLDYDSILGNKDARNSRLAQNLPLDKDTQEELHNCFQQSKTRLRMAKTILPDISNKTLGKEARLVSSLTKKGKGSMEKDAAESTSDLEKIYCRRGVMVSGTTEVRSAWKYNDLKPRVYYARGPSVYYASRYIQAIMNIILDCFPMVHRFSRFDTRSIPLDSNTLAFIYDYSSFTSTLHEIRNFTTALGEFYRGTKITLLDTYGGPFQADLGDIFFHYNEICNVDPHFEVSSLTGNAETVILEHNCGMLGVPGNISLATLLHGIHLICLIGDGTKSGKCVGDDAIGAVKRNDRHWLKQKRDLLIGISNIGIIEESKTEWWYGPSFDECWDDDTWQYLKRPITRIDEDVMDLGSMIDWPSLAIILGLDDKHHTITWKTLEDRQRIFSGQIRRFLSVLESQISLSPEIIRFTRNFMKAAYYELRIPKQGIYPQVERSKSFWIPPCRYEGDFIREIEEATSGMVLCIPKIYREGVDEGEVDLRLRSSFLSRSNRVLSFLVRLGILVRSLVTEQVISDEAHDRWHKLLERSSSRVEFMYTFVVVEVVPEWAYTLLDEAHVPHERSQQTVMVSDITKDMILEYLSDV